jgi:hypothetical protein
LWLRIFLFNLRLNPFTLKLPSLLSQYLREQKTLSLPGIGVFNLTGPIATADDSFTSNIQFQSKKIKEPDDKLINFIKQETGKMKPLAIADLETFIATGMELLAMGKPFQLEGIGSIQKKKDGDFEFVAGETITVKHEPAHSEHEKKVSVFEDSKYEPKSNPLQKILAVGLVLAGLGVVLFGGYYLYNRSNNVSSHEEEHLSAAAVQPAPIDTVVAKKADTVVATVKQPETYKYVLETKNSKNSAVKRYKQLRGLPTDIKMETTDSVNFTLYFVLPSTARDTSRIKDSLNNFYGKKIRIEL